jgi:CBS domain-containing protein
MAKTASDIMTKRVVCVTPETPISELTELLAKHKISGVPVVEDMKSKRLVGIVTEADVLARPQGAKYVSDIMKKRVVTVSPDTPIDEIVSILAKRKIKRVPVVVEGKVVGIVSRADIIKAMAGA